MMMPNTQLEVARLKRRWSVEVASSKVGVSTNTFNRWERGLQVPQLETLDLLCKAFDMSPEELGFENVISAQRRAPRSDSSPPHKTMAFSPSSTPSPASLQELSGTLTFPQPHAAEQIIRSGQFSEHPTKTCQATGQTDDRQEFSRRNAITLLISTSAAVFGLTTQNAHSPILHPQEMLTLGEVNIPLCWQLYMEGGLRELALVLPEYLTSLSALAQQPSLYQKGAATQASQTHQLAYLLALQRQDFGIALKHTQDAARYAQIADNNNLQVASLVREAFVYQHLKRPHQRLYAYQQALRYSQDCPDCSPLLRGYLYAGLAETYACLKNEDMARHYRDLAHSTFPSHPENNEHFFYTYFRWPTIHKMEGLLFLHLNRPQQARDAFTKVDQAIPTTIVPHRVEVTIHMAITSFLLNELEQCCTYLTTAVTSAQILGSSLRYSEAYELYTRMQERWHGEPRLKSLKDYFHQGPSF